MWLSDNAAQEQAALMYGAEYSDDVTGDGPAPVHDQEGKDESLPPDYSSDEKDDDMQDAIIDDAPYNPDPNFGYDGDVLLGYRNESRCPVGGRYNPIDVSDGLPQPIPVKWPALAAIEDLYRPEDGRPPMRGSIDNASLQLISNTMGSCPHAAHILLDNSCMRVRNEPLCPVRLSRGVRELNDIVAIAAALVHIASERITMELLEDRIVENAIDRPRVCVTETVNVFRAV